MNKKEIKFTLAALIIAPLFVYAAGKGNHSHHHHHAKEDVSSYAAIPSVALEVLKDEKKGWNIHVKTENFRFAPEHVNQAANKNEGHAHLYIDGVKKTRLYSNWYYLDNLKKGKHTISVSLNANNHADLVLNKKPLQASVEVKQ